MAQNKEMADKNKLLHLEVLSHSNKLPILQKTFQVKQYLDDHLQNLPTGLS